MALTTDLRQDHATLFCLSNIQSDLATPACVEMDPPEMAFEDDSPLSSLANSPSTVSSPLSRFSRSPSPPPAFVFGYPSPSSTQQSGSRASSLSRDMTPKRTATDGPPPPKRRKVEPKKRTTEYLDLRDSALQSGVKPEDEIQLERLIKALHTKQKIVVIAGAGISVSAGSMFCYPRRRSPLMIASSRLQIVDRPIQHLTNRPQAQRRIRKTII